uniref:Hexosyltransferase n=1 Tax=Phallusia mammillata TaxID=59560 RepID=A0A6F9DI79_9ASCI|nr:uncharacterized protein LOC100181857 [Phallusia mammillata]
MTVCANKRLLPCNNLDVRQNARSIHQQLTSLWVERISKSPVWLRTEPLRKTVLAPCTCFRGHHRVFKLKKRRILALLSFMMLFYVFSINTLFVLTPVIQKVKFEARSFFRIRDFHSNREPAVDISLDYGDEVDARIGESEREAMSGPVTDLPPIYANNLTIPRPPMAFTINPWRVLGDVGKPVNGSNCVHMRNEELYYPKWSLVIVLKSSATNFNRRAAVRETWGKLLYLNQIRIAEVFIIGAVEDPEVQKQLEEENRMYGDILQYDGPDGYRNMPIKVATAMQWASTYLPSDYLYASADDDFVVKFSSVMDFLEYEIKTQMYYELKLSRVPDMTELRRSLPIYCIYYVDKQVEPNRDNTSKWYVSPEEYPVDHYPSYCGGGFYIMPVAMTKGLYDMSRVTKLLPMDDVWVTGILRQKLGRGDKNVVKARWPKNDPQPIWMHLWGDYGRKKKNIAKFLPWVLEKWEWDTGLSERPHCLRSDMPKGKPTVRTI